MSVLYVDATECARGKVSWLKVFMWGYCGWFVTWMVIAVVGELIWHSLGWGQFLKKDSGGATAAVLLLFLTAFLSCGALILRHRRKAASVRVAAYGRSMREINRALKAFQTATDRAAGWPNRLRRTSG